MPTHPAIPLLRQAYSAELESVQRYLAYSISLSRWHADDAFDAVSATASEELGHAHSLAVRLEELGGTSSPLDYPVDRDSGVSPSEATEPTQVLTAVILLEEEAITAYRELVKIFRESDAETALLASRLLTDEERHRQLFARLCKTGGIEVFRPWPPFTVAPHQS